MPRIIVLESLGLSVGLCGPDATVGAVVATLDIGRRLVPGVVVIPDHRTLVGQINFEWADSWSMICRGTSVRLRGPLELLTAENLWYSVISAVFATVGARIGRFLLHVSTVRIGEGAVAVAGVGKSSTAYLLARSHSATVLGDDTAYLVPCHPRSHLIADSAPPTLRVPADLLSEDGHCDRHPVSAGARGEVTFDAADSPASGVPLLGIAVVGPSFAAPRVDDLGGVDRMSALYGLLNERLLNERRFVSGLAEPVPILLAARDRRRIGAADAALDGVPVVRFFGSPKEIAHEVSLWAGHLR